jgi:flagellar biosynthesis/type III secretory pathway M-ring protein FliF/YscJ
VSARLIMKLDVAEVHDLGADVRRYVLRHPRRPELPPPEPGSQVDEVVAGGEALEGPGHTPALPAPTIDPRLEAARALARDNPQAVANIVRGWVSGDAT